MALKAIKPTQASPGKPVILVYGPPGVGKTWAAMDFPAPYYIDSEGGANLPEYSTRLNKACGMYFGPDQGAADADSVLNEVKSLAQDDHQFKTVVIDSYSKIFQNIIASELEKMAAKKEGVDLNRTFGAEKRAAIQWTRRLIYWIGQAGMNAILICHQKALWKNGEEVGTTYDGWDKLEYELHLALQITRQGPNRMARVGKSRFAQFKEADMFQWCYDEFANRYGRGVIEAFGTKSKRPTEEQVAEYRRLLETVKLTEKTADKWSEIPVEDLDADAISARIKYIATKVAKGEQP